MEMTSNQSYKEVGSGGEDRAEQSHNTNTVAFTSSRQYTTVPPPHISSASPSASSSSTTMPSSSTTMPSSSTTMPSSSLLPIKTTFRSSVCYKKTTKTYSIPVGGERLMGTREEWTRMGEADGGNGGEGRNGNGGEGRNGDRGIEGEQSTTNTVHEGQREQQGSSATQSCKAEADRNNDSNNRKEKNRQEGEEDSQEEGMEEEPQSLVPQVTDDEVRRQRERLAAVGQRLGQRPVKRKLWEVDHDKVDVDLTTELDRMREEDQTRFHKRYEELPPVYNSTAPQFYHSQESFYHNQMEARPRASTSRPSATSLLERPNKRPSLRDVRTSSQPRAAAARRLEADAPEGAGTEEKSQPSSASVARNADDASYNAIPTASDVGSGVTPRRGLRQVSNGSATTGAPAGGPLTPRTPRQAKAAGTKDTAVAANTGLRTPKKGRASSVTPAQALRRSPRNKGNAKKYLRM